MAADYKDIVVHLDDGEGCAPALDVAAGLAVACQAHLTGATVERDGNLSKLVGMPVPSSLQEQLRERETQRFQRLKARFDQTVDRHGIAGEWRGIRGPLVPAVLTHAHHCDLLVMAQDTEAESARADGGIVGSVVLSAGVPVLAVPYIGVTRPPGTRVLLAWNGSREAIRAAHDALPLLTRADVVDVLCIEPPGRRTEGRIPGTDAALHLARLGVRAQARTVIADGIDAANLLLSHAADSDADLLVMGAYGHSRLRELVLGGVTRHVLKSMTVPVLLSH